MSLSSRPFFLVIRRLQHNAKDVLRYLKNERFKFSVTYYENNRPRQFYPDFIVAVRNDDGTETMWLAETKGEMRLNVPLKNCTNRPAEEAGLRLLFQRRFFRWRSSVLKLKPRLWRNSLRRMPLLMNSATNL
jgi:hypothetical protein